MRKGLNDHLATVTPIVFENPGVLYRTGNKVREVGRYIREGTCKFYGKAKSRIYSLLEKNSDQIVG